MAQVKAQAMQVKARKNKVHVFDAETGDIIL